jgi:hypothetical protein
MSAYPPPLQFLPTFNQEEFTYYSSNLTYTNADARYLKLAGGTETGLVSFNAGLNSSTLMTGSNNTGADSLAISFTNNLSNWTLNSQAALNSNGWTSACWSPELNLFIGVANSGNSRVAYSSNGIAWTEIAPGGVAGAGLDLIPWTSIIWVKELSLFVACGSSGANTIMTSPNGTTWTGRTADTTSSWNYLAWSPELGLLVAVATGGVNRIMTSSNATSWTVRSAPNGNSWNCVAWSPELGLFAAASASNASFKAMYSSNGTSWTQTTSYDEGFNNGTQWDAMVWCPEISNFICVANGSVYGVNNDPTIMTSNNGTSWGGTGNTSPLYKSYLSCCWAPEIGQFVAMANDSAPIMTYNNVSGYSSRSSASLASLNWNACAWSPTLGILIGLSSSGASRGAYSSNSNSININRNGNTLTRNGMLANIGPTQTFDRIKSNNTIYSNKLTSNAITSYSLLNSGVISNNAQNGTGTGAAVSSSINYFSLNDNPIFLRGTNGSDKNHFLSYNGTAGGFAALDGPILAGFAGGCVGSTNGGGWTMKWDSSNIATFNGNTNCNNSTSYPLVRAYKGSSTASAGVVTFQLQQNLGGGQFGTGGGTYMITMSLQSSDFGLSRGFWTGIVEYSGFAGGKAQGYTITSSNASFTSVSTGGLLTITVTASTSSTYEFTQMQVCY